MYFNLALVTFFFPTAVVASNNIIVQAPDLVAQTLRAKPNVCVALREGRPCFSDIEFSWLQPTDVTYCLRLAETKQIIGCWESNESPTFLYQFEGSNSSLFELIDQKTGSPIAVTEVHVQWVYTQRQKKRRWRLF